MESIIIIALFLAYITFREIQNYKIIKDLTLKIKARDVFEYKLTSEEKSISKEKKLEPEILEPEEAPAEDYLKAIQKTLEKEAKESG